MVKRDVGTRKWYPIKPYMVNFEMCPQNQNGNVAVHGNFARNYIYASVSFAVLAPPRPPLSTTTTMTDLNLILNNGDSNESVTTMYLNLLANSTPPPPPQPPPSTPVKKRKERPHVEDAIARSQRAKLDTSAPSKAVTVILKRLQCMPDEVPEVASLRAKLSRERASLTIEQLVHRWLQDVILPGGSHGADYHLHEMLLLCCSYAEDQEARTSLRSALAVPFNIPKEDQALLNLPCRARLFSYTWPDSSTQARAVCVMRGLLTLFGGLQRGAVLFATPIVWWDGSFTYETVEDCIAGRNRM